MSDRFPLVPRYRLNDEQTWLVGIDPLRRYWLLVNGDEAKPIILPGLSTSDFDQFRKAILAFRSLSAGDTLDLPTATGAVLTIKCASKNCFVIDFEVDGYLATHFFDQESLESLLMTSHPDWQCAPHHQELGKQILSLSWHQPTAIKKVA
ncbi:MAG: hypothetical protein AAGD09_25115 [Cyanobacteria bacterium P01_F01_bin.56]